MDSQVTEDYVRWLAACFERSERGAIVSSSEIAEAIKTIDRHARRWGGGGDFISLVAIQASEKITSGAQGQSFASLLETAADTVRHRVVRQAKRLAEVKLLDLSNIAKSADGERHTALVASVRDLLQKLSPNEQMVLQAIVEGGSYAEIARQLKVSKRTIYRRLEEIRHEIALMQAQ